MTDTTKIDIVSSFPEINPSNYNEDDVIELNNWGIEAVDEIEKLRAEIAILRADAGSDRVALMRAE